MHSFDFLSDSPKYFIFQKDSNKTNLGGVLFVLYMIVTIIIVTFYMFDYFYDIKNNQKYEINASTIEEVISINNEEEFNAFNAESETNPKLSFKIELYDYNGEVLSDNFVIVPWRSDVHIKRNETFECKVSDLIFSIMYKCPDDDCNLEEKDRTRFNYWVSISFTSFDLNHQSDGPPLIINKDRMFKEEYPFYFKNSIIRYLNWEIIKYNDENKGFMRLYDMITKKNKIYWGGYIGSTYYYPLDDSFIGYDYDKTAYRFLQRIVLQNGQDKYREYRRTKKSFIDVLANILALFSSFFGITAHTFAFLYSKNFDNYKIVEKILNDRITLNPNNKNKNNKEIELSNDFKTLDNLMSNESMDNLIFNDDNEKDNINNENDNNKGKNNNNFNKDIKRVGTISKFPKYRLWHFLLNSMYENLPLKKTKEYEFLSLCNEILCKYISIDYILYNQIKLENLFKDYKWNNPELNDIENNELISKLQEFI